MASATKSLKLVTVNGAVEGSELLGALSEGSIKQMSRNSGVESGELWKEGSGFGVRIASVMDHVVHRMSVEAATRMYGGIEQDELANLRPKHGDIEMKDLSCISFLYNTLITHRWL